MHFGQFDISFQFVDAREQCEEVLTCMIETCVFVYLCLCLPVHSWKVSPEVSSSVSRAYINCIYHDGVTL